MTTTNCYLPKETVEGQKANPGADLTQAGEDCRFTDVAWPVLAWLVVAVLLWV